MVYGDSLSDISVENLVVDVLSMFTSNVLVDGVVCKLKHKYDGYEIVHVDVGSKSVPVLMIMILLQWYVKWCHKFF